MDPRPDLVFSILTLAVSLAAVVHAMLTKDDPKSAVGWSGFILFVPWVGPVFYFFFGVNRIRRKARVVAAGRLRVARGGGRGEDMATLLAPPDAHLQRLADLVGRVTRRPILAGNDLTPLVDGEAAYPEMLAAIAAAERSVALSTYIFDRDVAGLQFAAALAAAAKRGVAVRVLIDDAGARYSFPSVVHRLRKSGVTTARFMRTFWPTALPYINLRNHRKLLVVDGRLGFTGGMNIRAGHLVQSAAKAKVRDLHFRVQGPIVEQLLHTFVEDWAFTTGEVLQGTAWQPDTRPAGVMPAREVVDGPDEHFETISWALHGALAEARTSVRIVTPYFLPDPRLSTALNVAAMRGVAVDIIVPADNNLWLVEWAMWPHFPELLAHGCRIWRGGPPFDHSKLMIVDDVWAFVGSSNWDPRSLRLNFEFNIEVYSRAFAARLDAIWQAKFKDAQPVTAETLRRRPLAAKLRDRAAWMFSPYL
jgi:cardiolipin synthase